MSSGLMVESLERLFRTGMNDVEIQSMKRSLKLENQVLITDKRMSVAVICVQPWQNRSTVSC